MATTPIADIKRRILNFVNVVELGSPNDRFDDISILPDGINGRLQITYGLSQADEKSDLLPLLKTYEGNKGTLANQLHPFLSRINDVGGTLVQDTVFKNLLKQAANDPIMQTTQSDFRDTRFFQPASNYFNANGFQLPLSLLVIYDSWFQSGGILPFLLRKVPTKLPVNKNTEKDWTKQYVDVRNTWLINKGGVFKISAQRTKCFQTQITNGNWDLSQRIKFGGFDI